MSGEDRMRDVLRMLAEETAQAEASPRVRAALLKELRWRRARRAGPWWMAAAAALVIGVTAGVWTRIGPQSRTHVVEPPPVAGSLGVPEIPRVAPESTPAIPPPPAVVTRRAASASGAAAAPRATAARLTATPWMVHQALTPIERGQVLRLPVSVELARQFGVPQQSGEWQAEIFVGDDGLARAFRLVRVPAYK